MALHSLEMGILLLLCLDFLFLFYKFGFGLLVKCGSISIIDPFPQTHHPASLSVLGMLRFANALLKVSIGPYLLFGAISLVLRARNMALTVVRGSG